MYLRESRFSKKSRSRSLWFPVFRVGDNHSGSLTKHIIKACHMCNKVVSMRTSPRHPRRLFDLLPSRERHKPPFYFALLPLVSDRTRNSNLRVFSMGVLLPNVDPARTSQQSELRKSFQNALRIMSRMFWCFGRDLSPSQQRICGKRTVCNFQRSMSPSQRRCGKSCYVWMGPHLLFCVDSGGPILTAHPNHTSGSVWHANF